MKKIVVARSLPPIHARLVCAQTLSRQGRAFVRVDAPPVARNHMRAIAAAGWAVSEDETRVLAKGKIVSIAVAASANIRREAQATARHDHLIYPMFKDGMGYVSTELMGPARGEVGGR